VLLNVRVSAQGVAEQVQIAKSSGFPRLDEAAREAVRRWRFVPARRGDEAIAANVIVPIVFQMDQ
jgi:protein TonB